MWYQNSSKKIKKELKDAVKEKTGCDKEKTCLKRKTGQNTVHYDRNALYNREKLRKHDTLYLQMPSNLKGGHYFACPIRESPAANDATS